jgi:hypothetical protein
MRGIWILIAALGVLLVAAAGLAPADYELGWWTVDSGGGVSQNASYTLSGTVGQADAGATLLGPGYRLEGGFWGGGAERRILLPLVVR